MANEQLQHLQTLIRRLTTAAATASLYDLKHQQVDFLCRQALEHFAAALGELEEISLMLIEQELIFDNSPLEQDMAVSRLIQVMQQRGIGHLKLRQGMTKEELLELVELLTKRGATSTGLNSTEHIRFGRIEVDSGAGGNIESDPDQLQKFPPLAELEKRELAQFMEIYQSARAGKKLQIRGLNEIVGSFVQVLSEQSDPILALAPLRKMDEYTYTHSTNVCILNIAQANRIGIKGQLLYDIGIAAMLHDIGKLFVPQEILQKPDKLDDREWQLMQEHPRLGAEYLANTPGVPRLAVITAYEHHMRYDGSGYPKPGGTWQQHLCSQMTTIADSFDAMRTHRAYRIGMDFDKICSIILKEAGTALHPLLVKNFLQTLTQLDSSSHTPISDRPESL